MLRRCQSCPLEMNDIRCYVISRNSKVRTFSLHKSRIMLNAANFPFTSGLIFVLCISFPMWLELDANIRSVHPINIATQKQLYLNVFISWCPPPHPPLPPARPQELRMAAWSMQSSTGQQGNTEQQNSQGSSSGGKGFICGHHLTHLHSLDVWPSRGRCDHAGAT